jgi:rhodanese-related sulfurtransferase
VAAVDLDRASRPARLHTGKEPALWFVFSRSPIAAEDALSPTEAATWIKATKNLQLIDVRTPGEYAGGHLAGAKLVPLHEIGNRLSEIDKRKPVLLYCATGHRSGMALQLLLEHGYAQVKHIEGGILAWQDAGLPVTK